MRRKGRYKKLKGYKKRQKVGKQEIPFTLWKNSSRPNKKMSSALARSHSFFTDTVDSFSWFTQNCVYILIDKSSPQYTVRTCGEKISSVWGWSLVQVLIFVSTCFPRYNARLPFWVCLIINYNIFILYNYTTILSNFAVVFRPLWTPVRGHHAKDQIHKADRWSMRC